MSSLAREVAHIARKAGAAIQEVYRSSADIEVEAKSDDSPLTLADRRANGVICRGLENLEVHYPIISEENKAIPFHDRKHFKRLWMVDPLDGTKEFIKRNGEFTVNIALVEGGRPVLGVVYAPVLDELYWAVKGGGAWLEAGGASKKMEAAPFSMSDEGLRVICSRSHLNEHTQAFIDKLNMPEKVSKGSSLKFLMLASGQAHLYPRLAPTMEWDTCAADLVLEEAGGRVVRADNQKPLAYNKEDLLNPHFIAYGRLAS